MASASLQNTKLGSCFESISLDELSEVYSRTQRAGMTDFPQNAEVVDSVRYWTGVYPPAAGCVG